MHNCHLGKRWNTKERNGLKDSHRGKGSGYDSWKNSPVLEKGGGGVYLIVILRDTGLLPREAY